MSGLVTGHLVVRNEEVWIWYVIKSVLPYLDKLLICDTGSEDKTIEIIETFKSDKITLIKKPKLGPVEFQAKFNEYKNELIDMTETPWSFVLDGDEVFHYKAMEEMIEKLKTIPEQWTVLSVRMKYFVEHLHRVSSKDVIEHYRFFRTKAHRWAYGYGQIVLAFPQPTKNHRLAHWYNKEGWDFDCFHTSFLKRSNTHDSDEDSYQRQHRKTRTQFGKIYTGKYGYSGPYPEVFYEKDVPEIVKNINPYIEQIYKSKEEFGM